MKKENIPKNIGNSPAVAAGSVLRKKRGGYGWMDLLKRKVLIAECKTEEVIDDESIMERHSLLVDISNTAHTRPRKLT